MVSITFWQSDLLLYPLPEVASSVPPSSLSRKRKSPALSLYNSKTAAAAVFPLSLSLSFTCATAKECPASPARTARTSSSRAPRTIVFMRLHLHKRKETLASPGDSPEVYGGPKKGAGVTGKLEEYQNLPPTARVEM